MNFCCGMIFANRDEKLSMPNLVAENKGGSSRDSETHVKAHSRACALRMAVSGTYGQSSYNSAKFGRYQSLITGFFPSPLT